MAIAQAALEDGYSIPELSLGDRLRLAREKAGLSREEMASSLGVGVAGIGHWENDRSRPKDVLASVARWAELTQTPRSWLLGIMYTSSIPGQRPDMTLLSGESTGDSLPRREARTRHPSARRLTVN